MASAGPVGILGGPTGSRTLRANRRTINTMADHRTVKKDGRHARGERNRLAILEACLALIDEGWLAPTAQLISERAGITIRSLFRHFPDMESLFAAANNEVRSRAAGAFATKARGGSLEERVRATVERYCEGYSDQKKPFSHDQGTLLALSHPERQLCPVTKGPAEQPGIVAARNQAARHVATRAGPCHHQL